MPAYTYYLVTLKIVHILRVMNEIVFIPKQFTKPIYFLIPLLSEYSSLSRLLEC